MNNESVFIFCYRVATQIYTKLKLRNSIIGKNTQSVPEFMGQTQKKIYIKNNFGTAMFK